MTKMILTVVDEEAARAVDTIRHAPAFVDGFEVRFDRIAGARASLAAFRRATKKPLIATNRSASGSSGTVDAGMLAACLDAGFDLVDIEWNESLQPSQLEPFRRSAVLSFHDFAGFPDILSISERMLALDCSQTKIAVTPSTLDENCRLLSLVDGRRGVTVIGMGAAGMYSRILAPFFGSELAFLAADPSRVAAPGQMTAASAEVLYGDRAFRETLSPESSGPVLFAVAGHPASHSRSPLLHNEWFRRAGAHAAYSVIDVEDAAPVFETLVSPSRYTPAGLSITAPFKEDAFRFASSRGADIGPNAAETEAVNTLVRGRNLLADNTDVDGFTDLLNRLPDARRVAVAGAGGTARAAIVAARRRGLEITVLNRTPEAAELLASRFGAKSADLVTFTSYTGDVLIDTLPVELPMFSSWNRARIVCRYDGSTLPGSGDQFTGMDLLVAQAKRQSAMFLEVIRAHEVER